MDFKIRLKQSTELCHIAFFDCAEDCKDRLAIFLLPAEHLPFPISAKFVRSRKRKRGYQKTRCGDSDTNEWTAEEVSAGDCQLCCAADNRQPCQCRRFAQQSHVTDRQQQISRAQQ